MAARHAPIVLGVQQFIGMVQDSVFSGRKAIAPTMLTSSQTNGRVISGTTWNNHTSNDWLFQGNNVSEPFYEGSFEADIDALAGETPGDDSGYYSGDTFEAYTYEVGTYDDVSVPWNKNCKEEVTGSTHEERLYEDATEFAKVDHGTMYDSTKNKNPTHAEKFNRDRGGMSPRRAHTIHQAIQDYENQFQYKDSSSSDEPSGPSPLEGWVRTHFRHESIAYRLEQPPSPQLEKRRGTDHS